MKELLSAFYDDELAPEQREAVADHLAHCDRCARELEDFRELSALSAALPHPQPPTHIWQQLEQTLRADDHSSSMRPAHVNRRDWASKPVMRLALAAAASIVVAVGWFGYRGWSEHEGDQQMAAVFGEYLEEFRLDPHAAQQILLANFDGQALDAGQAAVAVGYRPAIADGAPNGYSVEATYVMKMSCCTCVQCLCKRSDGSTIAIFEHDDEDTNWFGDRPTTEAMCNDTRCSLVQLDDRMAASWQRGKRHLTVIGARDAKEVEQLIAWFDAAQSARPQ